MSWFKRKKKSPQGKSFFESNPLDSVVDSNVIKEDAPSVNYFYPGGSCYINKIGQTDFKHLTYLEEMWTFGKYSRVLGDIICSNDPRSVSKHAVSKDYVCDIHRCLFDELYDWAGIYRQRDDVDNDVTHKHAFFDDVSDLMGAMSVNMKTLFSSGQHDAGYVARSLANMCSDFNYIHPFVNGNGRTQLLFAASLAKSAGYDLFVFYNDMQHFNDARRYMYAGDVSDLRKLFLERLVPVSDDSLVHQRLKQQVVNRMSEELSVKDFRNKVSHVSSIILDDDAYRHRLIHPEFKVVSDFESVTRDCGRNDDTLSL